MSSKKLITALGAAFLVVSLSHTSMANPSIKLLIAKAQQAFTNNDYDTAIESFEQLIGVAPNFSQAYDGLALAYRAKKNINKSIFYFKKSIEINPSSHSAYENLGNLYYLKKDFTLAEKYCLDALKINPNAASSLSTLAWVYLFGNTDPTKAIKYFKRVEKLKPNMPEIYYGLGIAYVMENKRPQVLEMITKLKQFDQGKKARELEAMLHDPRQVEVAIGKPLLDGGVVRQEVSQEKDPDYKVRLKGPLPQY